jgi:hypothetical protein
MIRTHPQHWRASCLTRLGALATVAVACVGTPNQASAQSAKWEVDAAPLYLWTSELDGRLAAGSKSVPVFLPFDEATDMLAGAFSFHLEARKGRWGTFGYIDFLRLETDATFTTPVNARPVEGTAQLDMTVLEAGGSYLVAPAANFSVIGGLRTYTLSPTLEFTGAVLELTPLDTTRTAAAVFGGFVYRPKLSEKWTFLSRADIGAGEAVTWSATLGFAYRFKPWGGAMFGFRALGVDTGNAATGTGELEYDVTHYGPMFALTLHWRQK